MTIAQTLIAELDREGHSTARILERVPQDKLTWSPHHKSMSLGQLAYHIATLPAFGLRMLTIGERDLGQARPDPSPVELQDLVGTFRRNLDELKKVLSVMSDEALTQERFSFKQGGAVVTSMPKAGAMRTVLMNHSYHHRGQLTVYLRLLDVPVPAMYGTSADENAFERRS